MTQAAKRRLTFEEYANLDAEAWVRMDLPEGLCEYWDGELVELPPEPELTSSITHFLLLVLVNNGIPLRLVRVGRCEVEVPGKPQTRYPHLVVLREEHLSVTQKRLLITRGMPEPKLVVEVINPWEPKHQQNHEAKRKQYQERGIPEFWLIDPEQQIITVLSLNGGEYVKSGAFEGDLLISSPSLGQLSATAQQIFAVGGR